MCYFLIYHLVFNKHQNKGNFSNPWNYNLHILCPKFIIKICNDKKGTLVLKISKCPIILTNYCCSFLSTSLFFLSFPSQTCFCRHSFPYAIIPKMHFSMLLYLLSKSSQF